ncbi:MAG: AAA family ATPase [Halobacteriovoraceae bacterium]|nr:AAA family ATPase [Halobacteriovoraceae bacterium]
MYKFDSVVTDALEKGQREALRRMNSELIPEHLLWGLLANKKSLGYSILKQNRKDIEEKLNNLPSVGSLSLNDIRPSEKFSHWITLAATHAQSLKKELLEEKDLLRFVSRVVPDLNLDYKPNDNSDDNLFFLINLNEKAKKGKLDPVIGRKKEIRSVIEILGRRSKNNPVLTGPAGVGKTAIVEGLANAIVKGEVPDILRDKSIYCLDMGSLMSGTKFQGEFEERIQKLLGFVRKKEGEVILFIDEIHQLVGAGKTSGAMDAANLLKPSLARGELHCIGATTNDEYQKYILNDSALERRFRPVWVNAPGKEDTIEILMGIKEKLEMHHGIKISNEAIFSAVMLSERYITDKNFPDKAIDLLDEASSALKLSIEAMPAKLVEIESLIRSKKILAQVEKNNTDIRKEIDSLEKAYGKDKKKWEEEIFSMKKAVELKNNLDGLRFELEQAERKQDYEKASRLKYSLIPDIEKQLGDLKDWVLEEKDVALIVARQTGIPVEKITQSKQDKILQLESYLKTRIFGQDTPLHELAQSLVAAHAGLTDGSRPLGSFLLKGPSGVGKTETVKALSKFLFNSEKNLIRLDMSEYAERHSVAKLIGAPAGYVGYEEGGILTEAVRCRPYSVILFDEIEKAHSDFMDVLLQILDDGVLTDSKGRSVDFKNTIVVMTTNSTDLSEFKTEVLGRIDEILQYNSLDSSIMDCLVSKQVDLLNQRLKAKNITIKLDKEMSDILAKEGYDSRFGARPLQSVFNKKVVRFLGEKLLSSQLPQGSYLLGKGEKLNLIDCVDS